MKKSQRDFLKIENVIKTGEGQSKVEHTSQSALIHFTWCTKSMWLNPTAAQLHTQLKGTSCSTCYWGLQRQQEVAGRQRSSQVSCLLHNFDNKASTRSCVSHCQDQTQHQALLLLPQLSGAFFLSKERFSFPLSPTAYSLCNCVMTQTVGSSVLFLFISSDFFVHLRQSCYPQSVHNWIILLLLWKQRAISAILCIGWFLK